MNNENNPQEVPQVKSVRPTSREYLKSKGLKNPPLDSGISGGGDAPRRYASDLMEEWSNLNGKFRDKALFVAESRIAELEAENAVYREALEALNAMYKDRVSEQALNSKEVGNT